MAEAHLYPPVKSFLEAQGYEVKGEVSHCDVVAVRGDEAPVIVELKERLNLALILQAVDRLALSPSVYIAFRTGKGHSATWRAKRTDVVGLARRLGLGVITVSARNKVEAVIDPVPYKPRGNVRRSNRLLKEFSERIGDPEAGGSAAGKRMTSYRQDALRCARVMSGLDELKVSVIREQTGVERAGGILRDNHYGWFERVRTGHYRISPKGAVELPEWLASFAG